MFDYRLYYFVILMFSVACVGDSGIRLVILRFVLPLCVPLLLLAMLALI